MIHYIVIMLILYNNNFIYTGFIYTSKNLVADVKSFPKHYNKVIFYEVFFEL